MTTDTRPAYADLLARQDINDALLRYCWGIDRGDLPLILSAFHDDAMDNHSGVEETAVGRFTRTVGEASNMLTSHNLSNVQIQVDGSKAAAQSYFTARHQFEFEGKTWDWVIAGRYIDKFECRGGQWRIAHRTVVYDIERFEAAGGRPVGHPVETFFEHVIRGKRGRTDYSYQLLRV
jgi:SnoaL-like protein